MDIFFPIEVDQDSFQTAYLNMLGGFNFEVQHRVDPILTAP
jgi:hypothetical protein